MPEYFESDHDMVDALNAAERALENGGCVVFPTDTVYGVGARPDIAGATDRLFEVKARPRDLTLPVLVAGTSDAEALAAFDDRAMALAHEYWPGGITLVLPRKRASLSWDLGEHRDTIGLRVPALGLAVALLATTGPLAVTSANRSGRPTPETCKGVRKELGDGVDVYICGDDPTNGVRPSTVVDLTGEDPRIVRSGVVPPDDVLGIVAAG